MSFENNILIYTYFHALGQLIAFWGIISAIIWVPCENMVQNRVINYFHQYYIRIFGKLIVKDFSNFKLVILSDTRTDFNTK